MSKLLDVRSAADRAGVSPSTIRHAIRKGHLKAVKIGERAYAVTPRALKAWINDPNAHKTGKRANRGSVARKTDGKGEDHVR